MNIADLVSLPTDNLYKFMAMSGLVVVVASIALSMHHYRQLQRRYFEVNRRVLVHGAKLKLTEAEVNATKTGTLELKKRVLANQDSVKLAESAGTTSTAISELRAALAEHSIEAAELDADSSELTFLGAQLQTLTKIALVGTIIGAALIGSGLFLWYTKVQVLLDQALVIQSVSPK